MSSGSNTVAVIRRLVSICILSALICTVPASAHAQEPRDPEWLTQELKAVSVERQNKPDDPDLLRPRSIVTIDSFAS